MARKTGIAGALCIACGIVAGGAQATDTPPEPRPWTGLAAEHAAPEPAAGNGGDGGRECAAAGIPDTYDTILKLAVRRWFPPELRDDWCWYKAQCFVESNLDPDAVSPANAVGLCQVTPPTASDFERSGQWRGNLRNARDNAKVGALAFTRSWNFWTAPRSKRCRYRLAAAGFNAGNGWILQAQELSGGALCWTRIQRYLPEVTGEHAWETIGYTQKIESTYLRLTGGG